MGAQNFSGRNGNRSCNLQPRKQLCFNSSHQRICSAIKDISNKPLSKVNSIQTKSMMTLTPVNGKQLTMSLQSSCQINLRKLFYPETNSTLLKKRIHHSLFLHYHSSIAQTITIYILMNMKMRSTFQKGCLKKPR